MQICQRLGGDTSQIRTGQGCKWIETGSWNAFLCFSFPFLFVWQSDQVLATSHNVTTNCGPRFWNKKGKGGKERNCQVLNSTLGPQKSGTLLKIHSATIDRWGAKRTHFPHLSNFRQDDFGRLVGKMLILKFLVAQEFQIDWVSCRFFPLSPSGFKVPVARWTRKLIIT